MYTARLGSAHKTVSQLRDRYGSIKTTDREACSGMGANRGLGRSKDRLRFVTSRGLKSDETTDEAIKLDPFDLLLSIGQLCQLTDLGSSLSPDDKS